MIFAVTDIETTGSYASGNSITEIAVVLTDGVREIETFHSLVRPDHLIPPHITTLTGITNEMVEEAPVFAELAAELHAFFEGSVFVAHNVGFDLSFIKKAFEECGMRFIPKRLCTVRASRKILPGHRSYSLGRLCTSLNISNHARHRALGDTKATVELLHLLLRKDDQQVIAGMVSQGSSAQWLPPNLKETVYQDLPEASGVYYLLNTQGQYLYIGMSVNIKKRIRQHFGGKMASSRRQEFLKEVTDIQYKLTGSEAIARLLEDAEIRKNWPPFNYAQKRTPKRFGLVDYFDREGYLRVAIQPLRRGMGASRVWFNLDDAKRALYQAARSHEVSPHFCGSPEPLVSVESADVHNEKMKGMLSDVLQNEETYCIQLPGRTLEEKGVILVEEGSLRGFGFIPNEASADSIEPFIDPISTSELTQSILYNALNEGEIITLSSEKSY